MAGPPNDTSEIRAWLTTQLKLEDVPEPIWELLVEDEYVEEAQYPPDFPDARDELVRQARKLLKIYRGGSDSPQVPKKQRTTKRQKATSASRSEVVGKIAAKIAKAKASKGTDASPNGDDERAVTESPVVWTIENNLITVTAKPWVSLEEVCMACI